jgi:hypothetical protein
MCLVGGSAIGLIASGGIAAAQDAPNSDKPAAGAQGDDIVVTGIKAGTGRVLSHL